MHALLNQPIDNTKRSYVPIRERYIKIVKGSRKLCIDCFEKRMCVRLHMHISNTRR